MKFGLILRENYKQLIFVFLAFFAMVLISYFFAAGLVERYMSSNAEEVLSLAETIMDTQFKEAEVTLITTSLTIRRYLETGQSKDLIKQHFEELTEELNRGRTKSFMRVYGYLTDGSFISTSSWIPPASYSPQERPWYIAAHAEKGRVVFTEPYINIGDGGTVISAAMVILGKDGREYGVISYDMNLDEIATYVRDLQFSEGGYGMLLGPDFTFIVHPDESYLGRQMQELSEEHSRVTEDMAAGKTRISVVRLRNKQGIPVVAFYQRMIIGWYLGIATPTKSYYRDVYFMALILSVVGAILMLALGYILIHLSMAKIRSEEESRSKSSFLARMSHEIRTPMNSILGMSEIIQRKNIPGEIFEYISIIRQSGNTLLSIINDILDFSKLEAGKVQIESKEYYFSSLINDVINVIRMRIVDKPLDFFVSVDSAIPALLIGDEVRIRQVLINLLNNAVKYTPEGHISLAVERENLGPHKIRLILRVSDTGIGIKKEDRMNLFQDFTRMDINRNQGIEGTGLGLAIANALCQSMEGEITVLSEYGKGSVFTASIIQIFEDDRRIAHVEHPEKKKVLIYEERFLYANALRGAMENLGLSPKFAGTFREFIQGLEKDYEFALVSSKYAMDCIPVWGKRGNPIQLVIMMELGESAVYRDTGSILMPIYSVVLANVLNGANARGYIDVSDGVHFTAPWTRILIVDDIQTNLRVAAELMAPYDMEIDTCRSGAEAIQLVKKNHYDLVFMDHMMPEMDGIAATAFIRKISTDSYYQDLPVVMLTANAVSGRKEMFLTNGINDFLAKPIEMQKLNAILEKWIPLEKRIAVSVKNPVTGTMAAPGGNPWARKSPEIPGIDTQRGIENTGGSLPVYFNILSVFIKDAGERIEQIREAAETGNLSLYTTLIHALKSAARSVGAAEFGASAAGLEDAGRARNAAMVAEKTPLFLESLENLITTISGVLAKVSEVTEIPLETDISVLHLSDLKEALMKMDIEKVNNYILEYSVMPMSAGTKELVNAIKEDILLFEYDKAMEKIEKLL
jgi:signal transduction histidine kinase/DNA-binding NarL/FixJ family response regulator/HPt (histidine-containing phosphotransfer) domain-containing protein